METDLAYSGAHLGSVNNSWLVILRMGNYYIFPSQRVRARASRLKHSCFLLAIQVAVFNTQVTGSTLQLLYEEHTLELMPPKHGWAFFITIVREILVNRHESSGVSLNLCPIRTEFDIFLNNF